MSATQPLRIPPKPTAGQRKRARRFLQAAFLLVGGVLFLELAVVAGLVGYTFLLLGADEDQVTERVQPIQRRTSPLGAGGEAALDPGALAAEVNVWDRHGPINILLLGLDHDICVDPDAIYHKTDTMIMVRLDPATGRAAIMSLPRDLFVHIRGSGGKKLTMAHYLGEIRGYEPGAGPGLATQVVRENFDLPVHRYVRIDFEGFTKIIDTVGPITVDVPPSEDDPSIGLRDTQYPKPDCGTMTVDFPPGPNELDGERALQYARSRKSTSDFDRSRRQIQVLLALRQQVTRPGVILDLPGLLKALASAVDTDLSAPEILSLARIAPRVDLESIVSIPIDENVVYDDLVVIDEFPQWVLQRDPYKWEEARRRFMELGSTASLP